MARNDWYEAGEAIRNLVQNAVENQDFSRLSETISNVVNQTVDGFQDALRESLRGSRQDYREGEADRFRDGPEKEAGRTEDYRRNGTGRFQDDPERAGYGGAAADGPGGRSEDGHSYGYEGYRNTGREAAERIRRNVEARRQSIRPVNERQRVPGVVTGHIMAWTGYSLGVMFGLALMLLFVIGEATGASLDIAYAIVGLFCGLALWMGSLGSRRLGLANRFRRYMAMLRDRTYCTLEELASGTGKKVDYVRKDLREMLRRGFFPEGHLDRKETCLITDNETYQQYLAAQREADRRAVFGQTGQSSGADTGSRENPDGRPGSDFGHRQADASSDASRSSSDGECRRLIEEGERYIVHIRECNDKIPGEEMSAKLDRLELVVTRIFREVERRPGLAPELRKMMSYYLPTTQKLIDAYCQLDEQPIRGQNIDSTKKEIENALDTINQAFENLLDGFFENTAWDISSDISVLHTMFAQEGLTGTDFNKEKK